MQPKGGRSWAWMFPVMAGVGSVFATQGSRGMPLVLAFDVVVIAVGLVGTCLLFEFKNTALRCGNCGEPAPLFRTPSGSKQAAGGGWTCRKCGTELDRQGRPVAG